MKSRIAKIVAIGVVIVFIIIVAAVFFGDGGEPTSEGLSFERTTYVDPDEGEGSEELLRMLRNLENIKLDPTLFDDPSFTSLVDYSRPLEPQPQGRNNPFLPLNPNEQFGSAPQSTSTPASTSTPPTTTTKPQSNPSGTTAPSGQQ